MSHSRFVREREGGSLDPLTHSRTVAGLHNRIEQRTATMDEARPDKVAASFVDEADGVYRVRLVDRSIALALDKAADEGDDEAAGIVQALMEYLNVLTTEPERSLCLACDAPVDPKAIPLIVLIEPARDDASVAVGNCMCAPCVTACPDGASLTQAVLAGYGRGMMVNPRIISLSPGVGHA